MATPDPQAFAKSVLWHLAGLRADVYEARMLVVELLARQRNLPPAEIERIWVREVATMREQLYRKALQDAGLEDDPPPDKNQNAQF